MTSRFDVLVVGSGAAGGYNRGLGLALAATVAVAHGGRIELGERTPQGLEVTLSLPRRPPSRGVPGARPVGTARQRAWLAGVHDEPPAAPGVIFELAQLGVWVGVEADLAG